MALLAISAIPVAVSGQGAAEGFLYVYPIDSSSCPVNGLATGNPSLNALLASYDAVAYLESFPGAQSPVLQGAHEIHLDGDVFMLKAALESTGLFSKIELAPYYQTLGSQGSGHLPMDGLMLPGDCDGCADPVGVTDPAVVDGTAWGIDLTGAPCAWTITEGDPAIIVAVIDTEFDEGHPDLSGKIAYKVGDDSNVLPGCYHGTQVTGMMASNVNADGFSAGIANKARVAGYVVEGASPISGGGCQGNPFNALWQAYLDGSRIMNLSWSGIGHPDPATPIPIPPTQVEAVREITGSGALLVVGAGQLNYTGNNSHSAYADIPGVVNVTAHMFNTHIPMDSPKNQWVDLSAPGRVHYRIERGGGGGIGGGTSLAAPMVAGTAALMLSVNPCLEGHEIEEILKKTAKPNINPNNYDPGIMGAGHLCAYEAVLAAQGAAGGKVVTEDEHWDYSRTFNGDVVIKAGVTLTVASTVRFGHENSRLVVEQGGKLIVDGGRLTVGCDNQKWGGIEVFGTPSASQFDESQQGVVELKNGALVELAEIGVSLHRRHPAIWGGGILRAEGAHFRNNHRAISFWDYENFLPIGSQPRWRNRSVIQGCSFTVDEGFPASEFLAPYFSAHIGLYQVRGIHIADCAFSDERSGAIAIPNNITAGAGIYSANAQYLVRGCRFSGLVFGINANNLNGLYTFTLRESEFVDNYVGLSARGVDNFSAKDNVFRVGGFGRPVSGISNVGVQSGVFIDRSSGFTVEGNRFYGQGPAAAKIGICARHTNISFDTGLPLGDYNEIFANEFDGLDFANLANGNNQDLLAGLTYLCNQNGADTPNATDFAVEQGAIAFRQIDPENVAAGNTFTGLGCIGMPFRHIDNSNSSGMIEYHYHDGAPGGAEEPFCYPQGLVDKIVASLNTCTRISKEVPLPPDKLGERIQQAEQGRAAFSQAYQAYLALLDDGDTPELKGKVAGITAQNLEARLAKLLAASPYLSAEVLKQVAANALLSEAQKVEVLKRNPEAMKPARNWAQILESGIFSPAALDTLAAARRQSTPRDTLERSLAQQYGALHRGANLLLRHYLSDTSHWQLDSIRYWAAAKMSVEAAYQGLDASLAAQDTAAALAVLQALQQSHGMAAEHHLMWALKLLEIERAGQGLGWHELSQAQIAQLEEIAGYREAKAGVLAQNVLNSFYGMGAYQEPLLPGGIQAIGAPAEGSPAAAPRFKPQRVSAFPNPASGEVAFRFALPDEAPVAELQIRTLEGKLVKALRLEAGQQEARWDSRGWPAGMYLYLLLLPDGSAEAHQLIIAR
jgi:subtilisin family serine protease